MSGRIGIYVCGELGSGKSALVLRKVKGTFEGHTDPSEEKMYETTVEVGGESVDVALHDTYEEDGEMRRDPYIRSMDGYVYVFDITSRESFDALIARHDLMLQTRDVDVIPLVIAGTKADLGEERQVESGEASDRAVGWGGVYVETSAVDGGGVEAVFEAVVGLVQKKEGEKKKKKKKCGLM